MADNGYLLDHARSAPSSSGDAAETGQAEAVLDDLLGRRPELAASRQPMLAAAAAINGSLRAGGTLFLCGNGGSHADDLHIAGELVKSFERPRPLGADVVAALHAGAGGGALAEGLQAGIRALALGANQAVASAIANDLPLRHAGFAQELLALGRRGDVLLGLSTSGRSQSVLYAASVARALGIAVVAFVGEGVAGAEEPTELARLADVAVVAPAHETAEVQGWHVQLYHCLCGMIEAELFPG